MTKTKLNEFETDSLIAEAISRFFDQLFQEQVGWFLAYKRNGVERAGIVSNVEPERLEQIMQDQLNALREQIRSREGFRVHHVNLDQKPS